MSNQDTKMEQFYAKSYQARYGDENRYFANADGKWEWEHLGELCVDKGRIEAYLSAEERLERGVDSWKITKTNKLSEDEWAELEEELGVEVKTDHSPKVVWDSNDPYLIKKGQSKEACLSCCKIAVLRMCPNGFELVCGGCFSVASKHKERMRKIAEMEEYKKERGLV